MKNKLHKYLDNFIQGIIEFDIPYVQEQYGIIFPFQNINVEIITDDYFGKDLIQISVFGVDELNDDIYLNHCTIRTKDIKSEFNNDIQNVIDYIREPLQKYNETSDDER